MDVVGTLIKQKLDGFGELFRMLSFPTVKAAAMLSRAVGGLVARSESARSFVTHRGVLDVADRV